MRYEQLLFALKIALTESKSKFYQRHPCRALLVDAQATLTGLKSTKDQKKE